MTRRLISSGSELETRYGYSRAVVEGDWVFVAGTTGFDYAAGTISGDVAEQTRQTFRNIEGALTEAGASLSDVVRARYIVTRAQDWEMVGAVIGEHFADTRPAATAIIAALIDPRMKVEIEVTAKKRHRDNRGDEQED
ncbi:MAG: RidA family protein [Rhodospirillaceae bacterium]|jgi:enamine deaminase RidA (YjgF/YER057c/UK114 family)|nr:RidA family protein [Rhodospirillaceae bacterium]